MILITGGAGFIGGNFILDWLAQSNEPIVNLDKLTYAGNPETLASLQGDARHTLVQGDIGDAALVSKLLAEHSPRAVVNFAAESHVDRSIHGLGDFIQAYIVGGRSQAIRLPAKLRLAAKEVQIEQIGDGLWIRPEPASGQNMGVWLQNFYDSTQALPEEFLAERQDAPAQARDWSLE